MGMVQGPSSCASGPVHRPHPAPVEAGQTTQIPLRLVGPKGFDGGGGILFLFIRALGNETPGFGAG